MTIDDKIRDERLQYDINREAAKIPALSILYCISALINMNILQVKKYHLLIKGKAFQKQTKTTEERGKKQIDAITNQNERLNNPKEM